MSHQYAHLYQHQQSQLDPSTNSADQYQPFPQPVSPVPLHHLPHSQPVHQHPITAPSPQYPQQPPTIPNVGYSSPPTSPVTNGLSTRRPLPTPGGPPSQHTSPPFRPPLPTPGPTPVPTSPQSRTHAYPSGSLPSSGITFPTPSQQPPSHQSSPASPTSSRRPLPLPRSAPGPSSDAATRSSSPAKTSSISPGVSPVISSESSPSSTKFVPYWKRTLPDPSSDRIASASSSQEAFSPAPPSGSSSSVASAEPRQQQRDRSKSFTGGRPLPPSPLDGSVGKPPLIPPTAGLFGERSRALPNPVRASTQPPSPVKLAKSSSSLPSSSALFSALPSSSTNKFLPSRPISPASSDDGGKSSQNGKPVQNDHEPPSPQYGIRDLPSKSRSAIVRNNTTHVRMPASTDRVQDEPVRGRSPTANLQTYSSHRSTQSVSMRSPALPSKAGPSRLPASTPTSPPAWKNSLPPLPRAPRSATGERPTVSQTRKTRREFVNLDDAPPPSLRRSPSTSSGIPNRLGTQMKAQSLISTIQNGDVQGPPRRSAVSVPSSPDRTTFGLPRVSPISTYQAPRSRSVTSTNAQPPPVEPRNAQLPPTPSRPPMSAFSQRFVSGKPTPADPQVTTTRVTSTRGGGGVDLDDSGGNASIFVSEPELPQITFSDPTEPSLDTDDHETSPTDETPGDHGRLNHTPMPATGGGRIFPPASSARRGGGLACGGCGGPIVGRIVSAMGVRWHPGCFRCSDCNDLLEYVSSYERDGKPYCHFDYHERFAPRCYHCKTPIVDERFITLDDPELGKRTYHEQHFFCSECGDPFLAPSIDRQVGQGAGGVTFKGDGEFENDDVGFTVYKGYPYCEACHVRLRSPKCKKCKNVIRDGMHAVEALGGKYHWVCFCCTVRFVLSPPRGYRAPLTWIFYVLQGCEKPFDDPSFFLRDNKPFCERCYSIILKSEL
ncbi:hypothetical protein BGW80DRAFT_1306417 [Lactifluus volemus]|nr:hypothetical protein BGW80DRAFT_1306417 [Lactifluus volemus]